MSTIKSNNHQIGQSATATNNATWYQPATPDGTVRLGVGNAGATTTDVITASSAGVTIPSVSSNNTFGFKNRIINGGMVIDQRNAGASVTPTGNLYTLDRWQAVTPTVSSKYSVQQSSIAPTGFVNSLLVTSLSSYAVSASDRCSIYQGIEGFNCADLAWGTANAKTVTISFWVKSSLTGTFGACIGNNNVDRSYPFSYVISAANTWEQKSITIAGDTTGTWTTDNSAGINLFISIGVGSTFSSTANSWQAGNFRSVTGAINLLGTNGATFYLTGVQLEVGSQATSFDFRSYGQELALCQRYFESISSDGITYGIFAVGFGSGSTGYHAIPFKTTKRTTATMTSTAANTFLLDGGGQGGTSISFDRTTQYATRCVVGVGSSPGGTTILMANGSATAIIYASAEL